MNLNIGQAAARVVGVRINRSSSAMRSGLIRTSAPACRAIAAAVSGSMDSPKRAANRTARNNLK